MNRKLLKIVLIANCCNGFSIKFKQTNQKFTTWKTSQSVNIQWRIYDKNDKHQFFSLIKRKSSNRKNMDGKNNEF